MTSGSLLIVRIPELYNALTQSYLLSFPDYMNGDLLAKLAPGDILLFLGEERPEMRHDDHVFLRVMSTSCKVGWIPREWTEAIA